MSKSRLSTPPGATVKSPPEVLTDDEVLRLMRGFTQGKTEIREDDALTLVRWATEARMAGLILQMILDGEVIPIVEDGAVKLSLPAPAPLERV